MKGARLPRFVKKIWAWFLETFGVTTFGPLLFATGMKTIVERWDLVAEREGYKAAFFDKWSESEIDFLITVPNATPSFPTVVFLRVTLLVATPLCLTFSTTLLVFSPLLRLTRKRMLCLKTSKLTSSTVLPEVPMSTTMLKRCTVSCRYQVVAPRLREETCLAAMDLVSDALQANGTTYELLNA